ncbi:Resolvase, N terminal domain [Novosphingobium sp. CF614]|uniref:recombinase family protein n=1 Tax=Novosphingobium sp. CF614 TaxID=1884364 RepID=UPI0008EFB5CA|nr:recombinase family protein [Novosphingobium sp. CF614]SFF97058.1 Resolvase, N terminal domain [Novosphingobium sp. CF614]
MTTPAKQKAVIYTNVAACTVADRKDSLTVQESRGRDLASRNGLDVVAVFRDAQEKVAATKRPGIRSMVGFLEQHRADNLVVLVDDIARLSRRMKTRLELRAAITEAGATLMLPSAPLDNDPTGALIGNLLTSVAECEDAHG